MLEGEGGGAHDAHLMRLGRACPSLDADLLFDPDEIQATYLLRDKVPPAKPRLDEEMS
ncbi:IS4 family transposase [Collimonas pratensis]|uniref:Transposase, is4 family domain protein n=1 Tax=Collimonas pratensis TaxID=279113 RepID=A0A127Q670_9BURK|nr:transposase, is4 family domain protein [Collimonas pratensis]